MSDILESTSRQQGAATCMYCYLLLIKLPIWKEDSSLP